MWKQSTKDILDRHLSAEAVDVSLRYFEIIKSVDELAAGRAQIPAVVEATADFIAGYPGNKFYASHKEVLRPVMEYSYTQWAEALAFSRSTKNKDDELIMALTRRTFHEVAMSCARIEGKDVMKLRSELIMSAVL